MIGLRVVFITTSPSDILTAVLESRHSVVGIIESASGRAGAPRTPKHNPIRRALAATGRRFIPVGPTLRSIASDRGIPHYRMYRGRDPELERWTRDLEPDVIAICGMTRLLARSIFEIPRHGAINLHPASLPKYRGANPFFWMYYNMEREGGVTVHFVDRGEDSGDIILEETYPIRPGTRMLAVQRTAFEIGTRLLLRALDELADGRCPRLPQPREIPFPRARRVQASEIRALVDWEGWPIERVWHLLAGTEGWIGLLDRPPGWRRHFHWRVGPWVPGPTDGVPGSVGRDENGYHVVHPRGKIRLSVAYDLKRLVKRLLVAG